MNLGPVTKQEKHINVKKFDSDISSENFDVVFLFPTLSKFETFQQPDSRDMIYN